MKNLLGIVGLTHDEIVSLLERASAFRNAGNHHPDGAQPLADRTVVNLFLEASTRTRLSFETAAKRLGAHVLNLTGSGSSLTKGESLSDTLKTVMAMEPDVIILRHQAAGAAVYASHRVGCALINAGDGRHEHPTQALLDALTVQQAKGTIEGLTITILGDVLHSRVARSAIAIFTRLGATVRVGGPRTLIPIGVEALGAHFVPHMQDAVRDADVVMALRVQRERMHGAFFPSAREYARWFQLDRALLEHAKKDVIVMHPGPMNRGVEISSVVADAAESRITEQVTNGVAVRMAVLERSLERAQ